MLEQTDRVDIDGDKVELELLTERVGRLQRWRNCGFYAISFAAGLQFPRLFLATDSRVAAALCVIGLAILLFASGYILALNSTIIRLAGRRQELTVSILRARTFGR
jgi:hypothetical protein